VSFKVCKFSTMFQWCGGLGVRLMSEGSLVQYALWGDYILLFLSATQFRSRGCTGSNLPEGKYWPFLPVTHSSIFLRNCWRNSSSVTLRYTSRFICLFVSYVIYSVKDAILFGQCGWQPTVSTVTVLRDFSTVRGRPRPGFELWTPASAAWRFIIWANQIPHWANHFWGC
jgi:hypothetical protein